MAVLVPCLVTLKDEINAIAPSRDKTTDGWIGDPAHQQESSDHNPDESGNTPDEDSDSTDEVHAIDVDKDLRAAFTMEDVVQYLLAECRKSNDVGKDRGRLKYIIYNKRIWEAVNGWKQVAYTGSNPHDQHAHFSAEYDSEYESDTRTWGLIEKFGEDDDMKIEEFFESIGRAVRGESSATSADRRARDNFKDGLRFVYGLNASEQTGETVPYGMDENILEQLVATNAKLDAMISAVEELVQVISGPQDETEPSAHRA